MRNLKKILALVLALVMSLSLMATAGAASFPDVDESNPYATAIDVLDQLKVFQGFEDGTFKPTDTLNRAQAAVLVYRIATGDVEGKYVDNYTYMAQSKFTDLDGYTWAKGYINYCQNAKIVVGTSATTFNPGDKVTGYQLMVMLLRTLGYGAAGEFADPKGWELETAKIAEREGILKNVTGGDFGAPAPRQMVAEILFRGLLTETVTYSALTSGGYTKSGETLGKRELGLEEIKGVVVANEYADLDGDNTLADGKTRMLVDGDAYTLDKGTTLDDIGEARLAYIQNGSKVLYLADAGNTTEESTNAEKVDDILSRAGISKAGADEYINFGKGFNWKSPWKIKYVIDLGGEFPVAKLANAKQTDVEPLINDGGKLGFILPDAYDENNKLIEKSGYSLEVIRDEDGKATGKYSLVYTQEFAIRVDITAEHQSNIKKIFNIADKKDSYITGEVYAGTTSKEDLSDKITLDSFIEDYITADALESFSKNENGNWVKVIDNNGDGKADYIFKVIYTVAQVATAKDGKYTLDTKNHTLTVENSGKPCGIDDLNNLTSQKVVSADELDVDDVVYYAIIDGKAQTYLAEVVPGVTIEKYVRKTETVTTSDGTDYIKSGVCEHIEDEAYMSNPELLAGKVSYDLFLDRGGHLAAFVKSDKASDYKLITDGWFNSTKTADEYAVRVYDEESERADKQEIVDLTENGSLFIDRDVWNNDHTVDNNDWGALKYLGNTDGRAARTGMVGAAPYTAATLNGGAITSRLINDETNYFVENEVRTTVAAITADGTILPVENSSVTGRYDHAMIDLTNLGKVPTKAAVDGVVYDTSIGSNTAYDHKDVDVTVRALDNTIYYVVYPADTASGVAVEKSVGYANAPGVKAWNDKGYVEDIYAVGTLRKADNDIDATKPEYTADIVVIELNYYKDSTEVVLVLDDTTKLSNVSQRELLVINGKGVQEIRKVDLKKSTLAYDGDNWVNGKWIQPGLWYMTPADSNGVYRLAPNGDGAILPLTADDIASEGGFAAGYVERVDWTGDNKYVVMDNHEYDGTWNGKRADEGQYDLTAETPLFRVEYDSGIYWDDEDNEWKFTGYGDAELTGLEDGESHKTVLAKEKDGEDWDFDYPDMRDTDNDKTGHNLHYYNYNRVLVHYDGEKAVYAVSFANVYDDAESQYNLGQWVWNNVMPAPEEAKQDTAWPVLTYDTLKLNAGPIEVDVEVNGETVTETIIVTDTDAQTKTIQVPYNVWSTWADGTSYTVSPANKTHHKIALDGTDSMTSDSQKVALTAMAGRDGVTQTIIVMAKGDLSTAKVKTYTFNIEYTAQNTEFGKLIIDPLKEDKAAAAGITVTGPNTINVVSASGTLLSSLQDVLTTDNDPADIIELYVEDAAGNKMPNSWLQAHTVAELINTGATLFAKLTNSDGKTTDIEITVEGVTPDPGPITPDPAPAPDADGNATAEPTPGQVAGAIEGSKTENPSAPVDVKITVPDTIAGGETGIKASLTPDVVSILTDDTNGADSVTVENEDADTSVTLPIAAINQAIGTLGEDEEVESVDIVVKTVDAEDVEADVPAGAALVDVTVYVNDAPTPLSGLGSNKISITIPAPEDASEGDLIDVYFVRGNTLVPEPESVEVSAGGTLTFEVDHLTTFVLVKKLVGSPILLKNPPVLTGFESYDVETTEVEPTIEGVDYQYVVTLKPVNLVKGQSDQTPPQDGYWCGVTWVYPEGMNAGAQWWNGNPNATLAEMSFVELPMADNISYVENGRIVETNSQGYHTWLNARFNEADSSLSGKLRFTIKETVDGETVISSYLLQIQGTGVPADA